jgi:Fe2+ transport system protein FeoA
MRARRAGARSRGGQAATFAELVRLGFKLGQPVTVLAREGDELRVRYNGSECALSQAAAAQVQVVGD